MARKSFSPNPSTYFMKRLRNGTRNEILFTVLGKINDYNYK